MLKATLHFVTKGTLPLDASENSEVDLQYLTQIIETKSIPGKIYGNSGMVHFAEINQAPPPTQCCRI